MLGFWHLIQNIHEWIKYQFNHCLALNKQIRWMISRNQDTHNFRNKMIFSLFLVIWIPKCIIRIHNAIQNNLYFIRYSIALKLIVSRKMSDVELTNELKFLCETNDFLWNRYYCRFDVRSNAWKCKHWFLLENCILWLLWLKKYNEKLFASMFAINTVAHGKARKKNGGFVELKYFHFFDW